MTNSRSRLLGLLAALALLCGTQTGCSLQESLRDGFADGLSAAVAYLVETPVSVWVDNRVEDGN